MFFVALKAGAFEPGALPEVGKDVDDASISILQSKSVVPSPSVGIGEHCAASSLDLNLTSSGDAGISNVADDWLMDALAAERDGVKPEDEPAVISSKPDMFRSGVSDVTVDGKLLTRRCSYGTLRSIVDTFSEGFEPFGFDSSMTTLKSSRVRATPIRTGESTSSSSSSPSRPSSSS